MELKLEHKCELCPCGCGRELLPGQKHHADNRQRQCQSECCSHCDTHEDSVKAVIIRLAAGAAVYAAALLLSLPPVYSIALFIAAYLVIGGDVLLHAARNVSKGKVFDENFLMSLATIGAFAIKEYPEAVAVMLFYQVGELFQSLAARRSRRSIASLMVIKPEYANLKKGSEYIKVSPEEVNAGDTIVIKPGERVPLDGVVLSGSSYADTSALTGESVPRALSAGDAVYSGFINQNGLLEVRVEKPYSESAVSRILELVERAAERKAPAENFISRFARVYTPAVVLAAALIALVSPLILGEAFSVWLERALIFLVVSCPCALVISIPLGFFGGIGAASRKGVLVKGGNYLDALRDVKTVVLDKTGTLTEGVFSVSRIEAYEGFSEQDVLRLAAYAESNSTHPIAKSIVKAFESSGNTISSAEITDYEEISGRGIKAVINGKEVLAGSAALLGSNSIPVRESGSSAVYVALCGKPAGAIYLEDAIKQGAKQAIADLRQAGVRRAFMLTGDREESAKRVAEALGLDAFYSELLPEDKVRLVEELISEDGGKVAFVGDGINDAPVLARADIGVAMGALGSDAAIEAADIVIMDDNPSRLAPAIRIARKTRRIVVENIALAMAVKAAVLILGAGGVATMWEAVFADVGVALLAILNSLRAIRV
jgi:Cd2+/Zn2+-exporting ATPase